MAEPRYTVTVTFSIGLYVGEWTGQEVQMEPQTITMCNSPSKAYAELLYRRISDLPFPPEPVEDMTKQRELYT
ncbi:MAG: hypothetical protein JWQ87_5432 [Candidatus Sulfotelmatobacter sp.]|nr:hypothetical protein [Candidatus Sulfotelmatobacter sp.]